MTNTLYFYNTIRDDESVSSEATEEESPATSRRHTHTHTHYFASTEVELVVGQLRRSKGRVHTSDSELYEDLLSVYNTAVASGGDPGEIIEKMSMLLKIIKDSVLTENPSTDPPVIEKCLPSPSVADDKGSSVGNRKSPVIPDYFRCPISLELMKDPVTVSTGQTYERACIEKWLEVGHGTCPVTHHTLSTKLLTPNYALRSLIAQWCEANGISKSSTVCSPAERAQVDILVCRLASGNAQDQLSAAGQLRLHTKSNADALRICIAEAGAIPLLVDLLTTSDSRIQQHAVTTLLNLSICEDNKGSIVRSGAVPGILHVLKKGSMEARENAASALFSLSMVDENKVTIGSSGAIPALVTLLSEGSPRGKKDAATALFHLCMYQGNKGRAVRAGIVPTLIRLLTEPEGRMVDESLAILAVLSSHSEGKIAIGAAEAVPALVKLMRSSSPMNKDNAAAVLVQLCSADQQYLADAQELGLLGPLLDMAENGTDRGKRKAGQLLECLNRFRWKQRSSLSLICNNRNHHRSQATYIGDF